MSNSGKDSINYFSAYFEGSPRPINSPDYFKRRFKEIKKNDDLFRFFSELFFIRQDLEIIDLCKYLFQSFEEVFGGAAYVQLDKYLQDYAQELQREPNRWPRVVEEQLSLISLIRQYYISQSNSDARKRRDVRQLLNAVKHLIIKLVPPDTELREGDIAQLEEGMLNVGNGAAYPYQQFISMALEQKKALVVEFLEHERIGKFNSELPQESS